MLRRRFQAAASGSVLCFENEGKFHNGDLTGEAFVIAPSWNAPCLLCEMVSDLTFGLPFLRLLLSGRCWPDRNRCLQLGSGAARREVRCFALDSAGPTLESPGGTFSCALNSSKGLCLWGLWAECGRALVLSETKHLNGLICDNIIKSSGF